MSRKEIDGLSINIVAENIDAEGYHRCTICNSKTALVYPIGDWKMDSEPYKNGEEFADEDREEIHVGEVTGHWCKKCNILTSLTYNFP